MSDAIAELCRIVRDAGLTMKLYGKPVTEEQLRTQVTGLAVARLRRATTGSEEQPAADPTVTTCSGSPDECTDPAE